MKKRIVSNLLSVLMVTSLLAGCSSSGTENTTGSDTNTATQTDTASSESTGEKTKLTALLIAHPLTADIEQFQWLQEMEDAAGVENSPEQVDGHYAKPRAV